MSENPVHRWIDEPPYGVPQPQKEKRFLESMRFLTAHHYKNCQAYRNVLDRVFHGRRSSEFESLAEAPFLPISMFKDFELKSIPESAVFKVLTSSGTTGQKVSRIFLDRDAAQWQSRVLVKIVQHFAGKHRRPMVIVDHPGVIKDRSSFSARGAGILGMSQFGREPFYALRDDMSLDFEGLEKYLSKWNRQGVLVFGFTFMVWQHLILPLEREKKKLHLRESMLVHSGGWKKLADLAVDGASFRRRVEACTGASPVLNFYGMAEQVGSVFFEDTLHDLHASLFSEIIVRDPVTLRPLPHGESGLIQVLSMIPASYPGHSILTEDIGVIRGEDDEPSGMKGKHFEILGRVPRAELRGCSDTFAAVHSEAR